MVSNLCKHLVEFRRRARAVFGQRRAGMEEKLCVGQQGWAAIDVARLHKADGAGGRQNKHKREGGARLIDQLSQLNSSRYDSAGTEQVIRQGYGYVCCATLNATTQEVRIIRK